MIMAYIVTALCFVTHDGATYGEGQEIPGLMPEQAGPLLACGVITESESRAKGKPAEKPD